MDLKNARPGRIFFPGSPWLDGHGIKSFAWSGRLDVSGVLWFDFHLASEDYDAEVRPEDEEDASDWQSPIVWNNYHACIISSTYWQDEHTGIRVGEPESPLTFGELPGVVLAADEAGMFDEYDLELHRAFGIYLLGHDGVADHRIRISRGRTAGVYSVRWTGRIARAYAGEMALEEYEFEAQIQDEPFGGFVIPAELDGERAWASFRRATTDHARFVLTTDVEGVRRFLPK